MSKRYSVAVVKGPKDDDGKLNVITCGYGENNQYGYSICKESQTKTGGYLYTDESHFFVKQDETTFETALEQFKQLFPPN